MHGEMLIGEAMGQTHLAFRGPISRNDTMDTKRSRFCLHFNFGFSRELHFPGRMPERCSPFLTASCGLEVVKQFNNSAIPQFSISFSISTVQQFNKATFGLPYTTSLYSSVLLKTLLA